MVVTLAPLAWTANRVQDLTDLPSTCTTQAPHWLVSQPTWVPVSPRFSRRNWTRRVRPSTAPEAAWPFTVMETVGISFSLLRRTGLQIAGPVFSDLENESVSPRSRRINRDRI